MARWQLLGLGWSAKAIAHRVAVRRLHPIHRGVYAVGRPDLDRYGRWMAGVLSCGPKALLSHGSAAALWGIGVEARGIEVSVLGDSVRRRPGIVVHRRTRLAPGDLTIHAAIPVTSPVRTLVDLATRLAPAAIETAVNEADKLDLIHPQALRSALDQLAGQPGVRRLRAVVDRRTFTLTDSQLERRFLPIARAAGLPPPQTGRRVNGFKVDFYWPDLGLVVETDGLRYHRTASSQTRDRRRDQAHAAAGLTQLRFSYAQVRYEPEHVERTLAAVARRLSAAA